MTDSNECETVLYRGFDIELVPGQNQEDGLWRFGVRLRKGTREQQIPSSGCSTDRARARESALGNAKVMIDSALDSVPGD